MRADGAFGSDAMQAMELQHLQTNGGTELSQFRSQEKLTRVMQPYFA